LALRQPSRKTKSKQYGIANIEVERADENRSPDTIIPLRISRAILDAQFSYRMCDASLIDYNRPDGFFDRHAPAWRELCRAWACASITRHHSIAKESRLAKPSNKTLTAPVWHQKRPHQNPTSAIEPERKYSKTREVDLYHPADNGLVAGSRPGDDLRVWLKTLPPIEESPRLGGAFIFRRCCRADWRWGEAVNSWQSKNDTPEKMQQLLHLIGSRHGSYIPRREWYEATAAQNPCRSWSAAVKYARQ
jgi:hypothetical protein